MTDYIINPFWFYLIEIGSNIGTAFLVIGGAGIIVISTAMFVLFCESLPPNFDNEEPERCRTMIKKLAPFDIIAIFLVLISLLVPSKETCYAMIVANIATKTNVELTVEGLKTVIDYIATTIQMIGG